MASGQEKDMAREEGPTAPNEVVNNAAEIDLNQDEAMAEIELDDIEDLDLDLGDEHNHGEAQNHDESEHHGEAENHGGTDNLGEEDNTGGKEATGDENDFTEGEGTTYPISEEIVQLQAKVATQNITILQQQTSIDGLKKHTQNLEARLSITMKEARVTAATRALDEVARRAVYGAKKQAQGPFEWPEFCTALKEAFMNAKGGSGWNKRPFHQRDHQPGPQAKRPNGGGGHGPNKPDFSDKQCRGCGRMGHVIKQCRDKNAIKYSGKPKPGGAGPSGKKDFQKPN
ncbi:unnamed protein product [Closterium sp. NIES-65]|nr:unnamed protein product [Closterium sp. NIES-65]